jgi:hypothetical protein
MKRQLCICCLIAAGFVAGGPAYAQSVPVEATITVLGSVSQVCTLGPPQVNVSGSTNLGQVTGNTVKIANLSDDTSFTTKATDFDITMPAICNFNHRIVLSSDRGGLFRTVAAGPHAGFADGVPYLATLGWATDTETLNAPAASIGEIQQPMTVDHPAFGDVTVHVVIDQGATNLGAGAPLVAGAYEDILRVTVGPQ